jgi:hypothetical protein
VQRWIVKSSIDSLMQPQLCASAAAAAAAAGFAICLPKLKLICGVWRTSTRLVIGHTCNYPRILQQNV